MNSDKSGNDKSVIHRSILPVPATKSNSYNGSTNGENPLYQDRETYSNDVSRATECGFIEKTNFLNDSSNLLKNTCQTTQLDGSPHYDVRSFPSECGDIPCFDEDIGGGFCPEEYEQWANAETNGNLYEEVNAPRGSADNTTNAANQKTFERGSKMLDHNTSAPARGVPPTPSIIRIAQQYLGDSVASACKKWRFLIVKSDKGTGKTTALRVIIAKLNSDEDILFVTPRKKLNFALANDLQLNYYENVKNETDKELRKTMARRMVVTPQSLGAIVAEFPDIQYRYIVLDESEAVASMLVSDVTGNKTGTLTALKTVAANAGNVVLMDAAIGKRSNKLMDVLSGKANVGELVNSYKRWANIDCDILSGGKYADRVEAGDALQIESLERGERIGISSGSASYCERRYEILSKLFPKLNIGLFTSKSSADTRRILAKPELAGEFDVLIFSPAVSIGVSFDIQNHFDVVYGVYPNVIGTGDSDDAIQGMARIRHPALNRWVVVLDDEKQLFKNIDVLAFPEEIKNIILNRYVRESFYAGCPLQPTIEDNELTDLFAVCKSYLVDNKNNYSKFFRSSLIQSGVKINNLSISGIAENEESAKLTDEAKENSKERQNKAKTTSTKIDELEFGRLEWRSKHNPDEITSEQLDSMTRFRFERKFNIDCDKLEQGEIDRYLELDEEDAISKCINREIALSDDQFTKELVKARVSGVGGSDAFKVDLLDDKLNYRLKKKLLSYAQKYFSGGEYSHADLKKSGLVQFIERNREEIIVSGVIPLAADWKAKPALILNHLLDMCGYGHKSRLVQKNKKRHYVYEAEALPAINILCQMRSDNGLDWITGTKRLLGLHEEILKTEEGKTRLERLWVEAGRTDDMGAFMKEFASDIKDIEAGVYPDEVMARIVKNWR